MCDRHNIVLSTGRWFAFGEGRDSVEGMRRGTRLLGKRNAFASSRIVYGKIDVVAGLGLVSFAELF
jgi:hypothetical protein